MRFAHISDTHIKNLKFHYEYRIIFDELYETLRKEKVDCIVHCGDIAHTKTQISPEFVEMCSNFFMNLASVAPTYIILGNHDGNLKNSSRQDALTPIVNALDLPGLHLLKNSGETHLNDEFSLNVLSVFDRDNWVGPSNSDKINIALYHGSISKCKTDTNWTMSYGDDEITIFDEFDFTMLGDIHRRQFLDKEGRIWYAGSTVQQNQGETNDKGILLWDIKSKNNWEVEPIVFKNPKPFMTIELTPKGRMPRHITVPPNARLRLVSNNNLPLSVMKKAINIAKYRFKPESITFLNRAAGDRGNVDEIAETLKTESLRDPVVQEELIREYLKDYQVEEALMHKVLELNKKYSSIVEEGEEISRNINWKLDTFEWDNLFNYGGENKIDFSNMSGVIGVFGKNFSGKSSIIDAMLYTMFNSTSKNERKNLNVINQNKPTASGKVVINVGNETYTIERASEKYIKRLKGEETLEAKTELNFECYDKILGSTTSLNGLTRNETDKLIRKQFGTMEDFLMSSMAAQHGSLSFIDEGSTRRKEIIAKFLDLEIFEQKFKIAKEDSIDLKGALKRLEEREFDDEITEASDDLRKNKRRLTKQEKACNLLQVTIEQKQAKLNELEKLIDSIPATIIDIATVREDMRNKKIQSEALKSTNEALSDEQEEKELLILKAAELLGNIDIEELLKKEEQLTQLKDKLVIKQQELKEAEEDLKRNNLKANLLDDIPCGDQYPKCKFIKDAYVAVANIPESQGAVQDLNYLLDSLGEVVESDETKRTYDLIDKHKKVTVRKRQIETQLSDVKLKIEKNNVSFERLQNEISQLTVDVESYEENKEAIENLEHLMKDKRSLLTQEKKTQTKLEKCQEEVLELYKTHGSLEQKLTSLRELKEEFHNLREEYSAYDLYMKCMHSSGVAYDIIKKQLPVINQEIAKVLANIVEFEVFFEDSGKKFDIFIKHPKHGERPIEMASGAEKTMGAMVIRLALLSVSSLPKGDIFILDEPGTALDEENMEGFIRILDLVKVYFKNVLLISHLDSLKDCVDMQIVIDKKDGFAYVYQ